MSRYALKKAREARLMSRMELAHKANLSVATVKRIEEGYPCRPKTKRLILQALGLHLSEGVQIFATEECA